ncbi:MAG: sensor histidine kinase [Bacteroidota bacterium]
MVVFFSMGLIHEKLYQQDNIKSLRLDEYLTEVSEHLLSSFEEKEYPIRLKLNCQPIEIDADTALTCCLIANEIVTNSVKYAFAPDQKDREVALVLDQDKESIQLDISDNGQKNQELPGNFKKSFGFRFCGSAGKCQIGRSMEYPCGERISRQYKICHTL